MQQLNARISRVLRKSKEHVLDTRSFMQTAEIQRICSWPHEAAVIQEHGTRPGWQQIWGSALCSLVHARSDFDAVNKDGGHTIIAIVLDQHGP